MKLSAVVAALVVLAVPAVAGAAEDVSLANPTATQSVQSSGGAKAHAQVQARKKKGKRGAKGGKRP